jgi:Holliday junction resolvase RusA-like endonuclease
VIPSIVIDGPAVGKGRPRATSRGGHARMYTPAKTVAYEAIVQAIARREMAGQAPLTGPVEAEIWVTVMPPKSFSKKKIRMALDGDIRPTSKPDLDNVAKAILDACNGICYLDDKQVTDLVIRRRYAAADSVVVYFTGAVL